MESAPITFKLNNKNLGIMNEEFSMSVKMDNWADYKKNLKAFQEHVNSILTRLVEKEKTLEVASSEDLDKEEDDDGDDDEDEQDATLKHDLNLPRRNYTSKRKKRKFNTEND